MRFYILGLTFTLALAMCPLTAAALIEGLLRAANGPLSLTGKVVFMLFVIGKTASNLNMIWQAFGACVTARAA